MKTILKTLTVVFILLFTTSELNAQVKESKEKKIEITVIKNKQKLRKTFSNVKDILKDEELKEIGIENILKIDGEKLLFNNSEIIIDILSVKNKDIQLFIKSPDGKNDIEIKFKIT